jgi:superfamily II DNA helicase RecQ
LLYFSKKDVSTFEYLSRMKISKQKDANMHALDALEKMVDYCTKPGCRRQFLLKFFGEPNTDPSTVCRKSCDYCRNPDKVTKAIEAASCANDFKYHTAAEKVWDGQWSEPHGESQDVTDDGADKARLLKSKGLSLMGEDIGMVDFEPAAAAAKKPAGFGFAKASDVLAKYEVSGNVL